MMLSDQIVVMNAGQIAQAGTPKEVYQRPASLFIASFLGQANFLHGIAAETHADGTVAVMADGVRLTGLACGSIPAGHPAVLVVRHDRVGLGPTGSGNQADADFHVSTFMGGNVQIECRLGAQRLTCTLPGDSDTAAFQAGETLPLHWAVSDTLVFPGGAV